MMYAKCDGCGKEVPAVSNGMNWFKPMQWYERTPSNSVVPLQACSRECVDLIEAKRKESGLETKPVIPV